LVLKVYLDLDFGQDPVEVVVVSQKNYRLKKNKERNRKEKIPIPKGFSPFCLASQCSRLWQSQDTDQ
jgi:hypothetical protein